MAFEYKEIVGWWGAGLSTILGYVALRARMSRIKFYYETSWVFNPDSSNDEPFLIVSIVNVSEKVIFLKKIVIDRFVSSEKIVEKNEKQEYLEKLSHGEQYKFMVSLTSGSLAILTFDLHQLDNLENKDKVLSTVISYPTKIRLKVHDTTGKSYKSNWFDVNKIEPKEDPKIINW